jgi:type I restriction enzyme R subunit
VKGEIEAEWRAYVAAQREKELAQIISTENLKPEETERFIDGAFRDGQLRTTGTAITKVLPPVSRFSKDKGHREKKQRVIQLLGEFFERFIGLSSVKDDR